MQIAALLDLEISNAMYFRAYIPAIKYGIDFELYKDVTGHVTSSFAF